MNIVFLLTHIPNPRMNKRIAVAKSCGDVVVICVRRASQDIWEPYHKDVVHEILNIDLPSSNELLKRILLSIKYERDASNLLLKHNPDVIYTEGLDSLSISSKYKKGRHSSIIYEAADLRESLIETPRSFFSRIVSYIIKRKEAKLFAFVDYLVVTSEKFYEIHYKRLISKDKLVFMPNIPDEVSLKNFVKKSDGIFQVGFIGGIRYLKQMKMLVDAAENVGCNVLFAGGGGTSDDYQQITSYCKDKNFVFFTGKYNYTSDIARLYGMVDCVFAVYDADNANVRVALPNKLYESIRCSLPIIVAKETYLAEVVNNWHVGISVSHNDINDLVNVLKKLMNDPAFYQSFVNACQAKRSTISNESYNQQLKKCFYAK